MARKKPNTIFQKAYDRIKSYKVSGKTRKILEALAKNTLKSLATLILSKKYTRKGIDNILKKFTKKTVREIGKDLKANVKIKF